MGVGGVSGTEMGETELAHFQLFTRFCNRLVVSISRCGGAVPLQPASEHIDDDQDAA